MTGSPWISSIQLPRNFLNSKDICPLEEILISTCRCCRRDQDGDDDNDYYCDHHVNDCNSPLMILEAFPCFNPTDNYSASSEMISTSPRARLHPFLEEFLVCAASKLDGNDTNNTTTSHGHVFVQVAYPGTKGQDEDDIDDSLQEVKFMDREEVTMVRKYFHIDKIDPCSICHVQDLLYCNENDMLYQVQVSLEYICSTRGDYDDAMLSFLLRENRDDNPQVVTEVTTSCEQEMMIVHEVRKYLQHRTIKKGCFLALNVSLGGGKEWKEIYNNNDDDDGIIMLRVNDLKLWSMAKNGHQEVLHTMNPDKYYIVGSSSNEHCHVQINVMIPSSDEKQKEDKSKDGTAINQKGLDKEEMKNHLSPMLIRAMVTTCPGYESLVDDIVMLANITIRAGSPSGVAIVGCSGVGKTRLATAVCSRLMTNGLPGAGRAIMILSCMDVLLEASSRMDLEHLKRFMFKHVFQCESTGRSILVIDDLDAIFDKDDDDVMYSGDNDDEKRIARNAVLGVMDDINMDITGPTPFILGLSSRDTMTQCVDLARVGRFEKIVTMSPPTELQRIEILKSMFQSLPIDCNRTDIDEASKEQLCRKWSTIIARYTSGCVAADLKRMCVQALTRSKARVGTHLNSNHETNVARIQWSDIREAARDCIPSQLSNLDVTLAKNIDIDFAECTESLRDSFFRTWDAKFAGYSELKAKIYRTIIWPWKRQEAFLNGTWNRTITDLERDVPPPTGVLFHGQSGTGKTFAAECLACSLGLNVIRVRATDILDQWLGGSEATIRALFARARSAAPCALFFDDLDAIAANRENDGDSTDVYSRLLSTLLNEIDGISSSNALNGILIVGTTNRMQAIDAALLRPGRFEEHLLLDLPSKDDIQEMLNMFLAKVPMDSKVDLQDIAELLEELNACAADVKGLCSEACLHAIGKVEESTNISNIVLEVNDFDHVIIRWKQ